MTLQHCPWQYLYSHRYWSPALFNRLLVGALHLGAGRHECCSRSQHESADSLVQAWTGQACQCMRPLKAGNLNLQPLTKQVSVLWPSLSASLTHSKLSSDLFQGSAASQSSDDQTRWVMPAAFPMPEQCALEGIHNSRSIFVKRDIPLKLSS